MINGVKSFCSVEEEDEMLDVFLNTFEEEVIEVNGMIHTIFAPEEAFLGGVNKGGDSRHDRVGHSGSKNTVVGVGDTNRTSVRD